MPLKLNVGLSRKIGEPNFGSRGASVNVEMELDSSLVSDPPKLQERIRQLFGIVRSSLAHELNGNGQHVTNNRHAQHQEARPSPEPSDSEAAPRTPPRRSRPATASQVKAIYGIARAKQINLQQFLHERYGATQPDNLTIEEASKTIDGLKDIRQPGDEG
jgi:hypothetical protein